MSLPIKNTRDKKIKTSKYDLVAKVPFKILRPKQAKTEAKNTPSIYLLMMLIKSLHRNREYRGSKIYRWVERENDRNHVVLIMLSLPG